MSTSESTVTSLVRHKASVTRARREQLNGHPSAVVWFTGLSGAGKSTLAYAVEERLHQTGRRTFVFDGDSVRHGLCADLGFSPEDRAENVRRVAEVARLFLEAGVVLLAAFISPFQGDRDRVRSLFAQGEFLEVFVRCPVVVCEGRDVKGLYRKARTGEIKEFTGVSSPYEEPEHPELVIDTSEFDLEHSVEAVLGLLRLHGVAP